MGWFCSRRGEEAPVISQFREALRLDPTSAVLHYNLANTLAPRKDWESAVAEYRLALERDPTFAEAHNNLGHV